MSFSCRSAIKSCTTHSSKTFRWSLCCDTGGQRSGHVTYLRRFSRLREIANPGALDNHQRTVVQGDHITAFACLLLLNLYREYWRVEALRIDQGTFEIPFLATNYRKLMEIDSIITTIYRSNRNPSWRIEEMSSNRLLSGTGSIDRRSNLTSTAVLHLVMNSHLGYAHAAKIALHRIRPDKNMGIA